MSQKRYNPKPRNPYVAAAKFRRAGAHDKTEKARRRHDAVALVQAIRGSRRNDGEAVFQTTVSGHTGRSESPFVRIFRNAEQSCRPIGGALLAPSGQEMRNSRFPFRHWR